MQKYQVLEFDDNYITIGKYSFLAEDDNSAINLCANNHQRYICRRIDSSKTVISSNIDDSNTFTDKKTDYQKVLEFHQKFDMHIGAEAKFPDDNTINLRRDLIEEELREYYQSVEARDIVNVAKELADIVYVIHGTAIAYGINLDKVFNLVHNNNMSKLQPDGTVKRREDGKVIKPDNFKNLELKYEDLQ